MNESPALYGLFTSKMRHEAATAGISIEEAWRRFRARQVRGRRKRIQARKLARVIGGA